MEECRQTDQHREIMPNHTIDITEARAQINKLDDRLRDERIIKVTRHNKPVFAFVDLEYLSTVLETIEIMTDPDTCKMLQESLEDIKHGRVHDHEDVRREFCE